MNRLRVLVVNSSAPEAERMADRLASADHSALPASGLEEACEALFVQKFDAVLVGAELPADAVQEFTAKLRELERGQRSGTPAPVLSISAQVPNGSAWRAGEQGIDAYLPESFRPVEFVEAVTSLADSISRKSEPASQIASKLPVFETERFYEHVARDKDLMKEIIDLFLSETPAQMIELREAIAGGDFKMVERIAHTIKGSLATLHAQQARSRAQQLESGGKNGDLEQCHESLSGLESDLEALEPQLLSLRDGSGSA